MCLQKATIVAGPPVVFPGSGTLSPTSRNLTIYGRGFDTVESFNAVSLSGFNLTARAAVAGTSPFVCNAARSDFPASFAAVVAANRFELTVALLEVSAQQAVVQAADVVGGGASCTFDPIVPLAAVVSTSGQVAPSVDVHATWASSSLVEVRHTICCPHACGALLPIACH